ncbi:putative serine protease K12H4.7 isoform X2 [Planococcus citri]|uniref:putative serine protease K12H4.7 isoform X2 n=1 Tax=Planococcus citri TaxID=170843 RepID=UPI0031F8F784
MPNTNFFYCIIFATQVFITASLSSKLNSRKIFDDFEIEYPPSNDGSSDPKYETNSNSAQFGDQFFLQKLDHSRPTDNRTWHQRYFVNDFYYEDDGPVFLFVYGESEANPKWMGKGPQWTAYAKKFNALCFGLEHRFYGQSRPKENTNTSNLQYLTTEQVLADIAYFIEGINRYYNLSSDTKWVLFGGSYAGSLVAWARMKYPHLVHGAVASSAPLLAKTDFPEYLQVVERSLKTHSHKCAKNIYLANRRLKRAIRTSSGRKRVSKMFKLCSILKDDRDDITTFFEVLTDNIAIAVQYDKKFSSTSIKDVCHIMNDDEKSLLERYANVNKEFLKFFNESCTSPKYADFIQYYKEDTYGNDSLSSRLWLYQTCSEYGFYQTSSKPKDLFGSALPIDYFIKTCQDVFGTEFNRDFIDDAAYRTNVEFGALKFNTSNVVFVHGRIDPWHSLGLYNQFQPAAHKVITMSGTSHCRDMYPSNTKDDSEELVEARQKILDILKSWLENEKSSSSSTQEVVNINQ